MSAHIHFWTGLIYTIAAASVGALGHMATEMFRYRASHRKRGRRRYDR